MRGPWNRGLEVCAYTKISMSQSVTNGPLPARDSPELPAGLGQIMVRHVLTPKVLLPYGLYIWWPIWQLYSFSLTILTSQRRKLRHNVGQRLSTVTQLGGGEVRIHLMEQSKEYEWMLRSPGLSNKPNPESESLIMRKKTEWRDCKGFYIWAARACVE